MNNPLLERNNLPAFQHIKTNHVVPAIDTVLNENRRAIAALTANTHAVNWENFVEPLDDLEDHLHQTWSPISHLNSVANEAALRDAYNACLPKLSNYATELGQNHALYLGYKTIADSKDYATLSAAQRKTIDNALRDFHLAGVDLPELQQQRFKAIAERLSTLSAKFSDNVLDATQAWTYLTQDPSELAGLPESALAQAQQAAEQKSLDGWLLTLEFPSYFAVVTHADSRELRKKLHDAYVTRASDQGPKAGEFDNGPIMDEILQLRHEKAQLLGFANYAEYSLATKMAKSTDEVVQFLNELAQRSRSMAKHELAAMQDFAREQHGLDSLQPWDMPYIAENLRLARYDINQEMLRPYFPDNKVLAGLFQIVRRLYGMQLSVVDNAEVWNEAVHLYQIHDEQGQMRGHLFVDLYARAHKRGGAWMDEYRSRRKINDGIQTPVAYVTCNFTPPVGKNPALLTHDEVTTLFHEFGHALHHLLTKVDVLPVSGIQGVPWDAVELPSQFFENWCWEKESLDLISGHYKTGVSLPNALFAKLIAARNFNAGLTMLRQIEFSLFDFRLHREYDSARGPQIQQMLNQIREEIAVVKPADYNRFQHSFSHIFAGGYAAGYYSYKWAEVLSADAFSLFEEKGLFDPDTGRSFLQNILEKGGSADPLELFIHFRGREPRIDALLRHNGITG